jgi:carbon monoxide dehydrogenase subunit G
MEIENEFDVPAPVDHVWTYLLDVERVAPCMPGAELTEVIDDHTWKGKVNMKLGPVSLAFAGTVTMQERDDQAKRIVLAAKGMEQKGKGAANASVTSWLEQGDGVTNVKMRADIHLTGTVAQLSRGLLPEVSRKLTQQFADCLLQSMQAAEVQATESAGHRGRGGGSRRTVRAGRADRRDPPRVRRDLGVDQGLLPASVRQARGVISALVLAAGEGTRFGGTKQLEILRGKTLVQHAVDAASAAGVGEIVVVLGHDALRVRDALDLPERTRIVVNERYADGQSTSLAAGTPGARSFERCRDRPARGSAGDRCAPRPVAGDRVR